jgi:hypothetical protein
MKSGARLRFGLSALLVLGGASCSGAPSSSGPGTPDAAGLPGGNDASAPGPPPDAGVISQDASHGGLDSGLAGDTSSGPVDASTLDASDTSGPTSRQLDIPPRNQWTNANGYCGEISIQSIALYYGTWVSEDVVRTVAGGELLIGVNGPAALTALHFAFTQWDTSAPQPQFHSFLVWMKTNLALGVPSFFGAYLTDGNNDPDYDHIMPATGIQFTAASAYDPTDVLTYNDNFGDRITRAAGALSATRASCSYSSTQGGCIPQDVDYGIAVTGIVDPQHVTLPVSLSVPSNSEPNVSTGAAPVQITGTVTVSGLQPGTSYALLRYDDVTQVPTSGSAASFLASRFTYRTDFTAAAATWSLVDPNTFTSGGTTVYRCVPR